ncbi:MAG: pyridoxal phosphate-dependent aminotransferase [Saccharofermentanales bacterium]
MENPRQKQPASRFWSYVTQTVEPYVPGEQPRERLIKLNTNENPYPPSPAVAAALRNIDPARLRLYPDPSSLLLRQSIGAYYNLAENQIFCGNGSDEILAFCFQAFFNPAGLPDSKVAAPNEQIVFPDVTYSFYPVYAHRYDIPYRTVNLLPDLSMPLADLMAPSAGIILANPNAPTGMGLPLTTLAQIAASDPDRLIIIDEAYIDFGGETAVPLLEEYDNILIVQTFSKSRSLAGMRLGFALGAPALISGLERIRDSFNSYTVDYISQITGIAAMNDGAWFEETRSRIIATREKSAAALAQLGFEVVSSQANFIFARHPQHTGRFLQQSLRERGILVRRFNQQRITDYLRISIGTEPEMQTLAEALGAIIASPVAGASEPTL